ncbi:CGNR zinc finger domain-containing protein [Asanoa sp. WMMD1127]|uniref:CGNR zinc finger domain-containing protein n=1 Tax=Asanoa sp. WMMD1127 TaxID=3016107 RepID=UPI002415FEFF|nr:CGNR zinc finger domain-containing protein [Asanoa sp. WMMD1127]MDG4826221.1 CGNR zinc finger domain-containing protein [Asanoa sp. WMMD1127]
MVFAHDTEAALVQVAALVNTPLADVAALDAFLVDHEDSGVRAGTEAELAEVRALRPVFRRFWELGEDDLVELVNGLLRDSRPLPQLVRHDGWDYHLHAVPRDAPLAVRMTVEAAMALVDVVRTQASDRLRLCAYPDCGNVLVDLSRNRSKRFCDAGCGNRAAVNAYRARRAALIRPPEA